jgi:hypothetical protein
MIKKINVTKTINKVDDKKNKVDISKVKILDTSDDDTINDVVDVDGGANKEVDKKYKPKKISDTKYERPELTYSDLLTKKDIEGLLLDYEKVDADKLDSVLIGTHIRYFENKDGELKFRVGGVLKFKGLPDYIVLNNGKVGWSVQVKKCIFFKKITLASVREEYNQIIISKDIELEKLRTYIKTLEKEILKFKKQLKSK